MGTSSDSFLMNLTLSHMRLLLCRMAVILQLLKDLASAVEESGLVLKLDGETLFMRPLINRVIIQ